ncbi:hypothetical protein TUM4641_31090 [Shewanella morhuae]|nr:hypothetical protein TUM4641_31090 [Shewanella morhuae]
MLIYGILIVEYYTGTSCMKERLNRPECLQQINPLQFIARAILYTQTKIIIKTQQDFYHD